MPLNFPFFQIRVGDMSGPKSKFHFKRTFVKICIFFFFDQLKIIIIKKKKQTKKEKSRVKSEVSIPAHPSVSSCSHCTEI